MSYLAIAFDLGGVIVDSESMHEHAARIVARAYGLSISEDYWSRVHGASYESFFGCLWPLATDPLQRPRLLSCISESYRWYYRLVKRRATLYNGAIEVLETARTRFQFVALTTSIEWPLVQAVFSKFKKHRLSSYFDHVISGSQVMQTKPFPEPYLVTAHYFGVKPRDMIVVEDSLVGLRSARLSGVRARILLTTGKEKNTHAKRDPSGLLTKKTMQLSRYTVKDHESLERLLRYGLGAEYGGTD
jgi:beta-phosphoglucomutase